MMLSTAAAVPLATAMCRGLQTANIHDVTHHSRLTTDDCISLHHAVKLPLSNTRISTTPRPGYQPVLNTAHVWQCCESLHPRHLCSSWIRHRPTRPVYATGHIVLGSPLTLLRLPRQKLILATGILTGHSQLNRHLSVMGIISDPTCDYCEDGLETAAHFLRECSHFVTLRQEIWGKSY